MPPFFTEASPKKQILVGLKVKAAAKSNIIDRFMLIDGKTYLKIFIKTEACEGKANKEIINFLAKEWKISKSNLKIIRGEYNYLKILAIKNTEASYLNSIFLSVKWT